MRQCASLLRSLWQAGATVERLRQAGCAIAQGPDRRGDGADFLFCDDPDGIRIEITHHQRTQPAVLVGKG